MSIKSASLASIFGIIALAEPLSLRIAQAANIKIDSPNETLSDRPLSTQRFSQWCQTKDSYPAATQKTILALLITAGTEDCQQAELELRSLTELSLSWITLGKMGNKLPDYQSPEVYGGIGIGFNRISDLRPLASLDNLTSLDLSSNLLEDLGTSPRLDLQPIANLTNLTYLNISYSTVDNIQPLKGLVKLRELDLNRNYIKDLQPLVKLTNLVSLNLKSNKIQDLQPLTGLQNLTRLHLDYNQITNTNALCRLPKLMNLSLKNNPVSRLTCGVKALLQ
jgi:internalin A